MSLANPPAQGVLQDCTYRNTTDRMVILRCCGTDQFFLERVVFPFEVLAFLCPPLSEVKIWSHGLYGPELLETLTSDHLLVEPSDPSPHPEQEGMFPSSSSALETTPWLQAS
ncbi:MAG: DUF1830 domain-containing protein [Cyanobium sp.]